MLLSAVRYRIVLIVMASFLFSATAPVFAAEQSEARQGRLENGLTYFIDPSKPVDGKISFRLLVRVGFQHSLPDEQSVAHVVEHIVHASDHVADRKGDLRSRVELLGGAWGRDINASTADTYTVYYVRLPTADTRNVEAGLEIIQDWITPRSFSDEEIDRESKVVIEELRGTSVVEADRWAAQNHTWFAGHKLYDYERDKVGKLSATAGGIRMLYRRWYTPANMAIIVQGVDVETALAVIKRRLAPVPRGEPMPALDETENLPVKGGSYVVLPSDERSESRMELTFKYRPEPSGSIERTKEIAIGQIVDVAARAALGRLGSDPDPAVNGVSLRSKGLFHYPQLDMLTVGTSPVRGKTREALATLLRVVDTIRHVGLPSAVISTARNEVSAALADQTSSEADRFEASFLYGAAEPSPAEIRSAVNQVTDAEINDRLRHWLDNTNRDVFIFYSKMDLESAPNATEFLELSQAVKIEPPLQLTQPEIKYPTFTAPVPAKPTQNDLTVEGQGFVSWGLPLSGATLLYRRTRAEEAELLLSRRGGFSNGEPKFEAAAAIAAPVVARSGLAGLEGFELARFYEARGISLVPQISATREGLQASGPMGEWPLMLQLAREQMLKPLCRAEVFEEVRRERLNQDNMEERELDREKFIAMTERVLGNPSPNDADTLRSLSAADVCRAYDAMSGDTAGMVIVVEGNFDPSDVYSSISATLDLPAIGVREANSTKKRIDTTHAGRDVLRSGNRDLASVNLVAQWPAGTDERAGAVVASIMGQRMTARLRAVEKGTYSVDVGFVQDAQGAARFHINFETAAGSADRMIAAAKDELLRLRRAGPTKEEIASARIVGATNLNPLSTAAEAWLTRGKLVTQPAVDDSAIRRWINKRLDLSRFHEFVLLPES